VLSALRGAREALTGDAAMNRTVETLLAELADGEARAAGGQSLADLLAQIPPQAEPASG